MTQFNCKANGCTKSFDSPDELLGHYKAEHVSFFQSLLLLQEPPPVASSQPLLLSLPSSSTHPRIWENDTASKRFGQWGLLLMKKWKMYPDGKSAEEVMELLQKAEKGDKSALCELSNLAACVPPDFFVIKGSKKEKLIEHAQEIMGVFLPSDLTETILGEYSEDMKQLRRQLGTYMREIIKACLLQMVVDMDGGHYKYLIRSYADIKSLCGTNGSFKQKVTDLLSNAIFAPNSKTRKDFEQHIMRALKIEYRLNISGRKQQSSSILRFLSNQIEGIRAPFRSLVTVEAPTSLMGTASTDMKHHQESASSPSLQADSQPVSTIEKTDERIPIEKKQLKQRRKEEKKKRKKEEKKKRKKEEKKQRKKEEKKKRRKQAEEDLGKVAAINIPGNKNDDESMLEVAPAQLEDQWMANSPTSWSQTKNTPDPTNAAVDMEVENLANPAKAGDRDDDTPSSRPNMNADTECFKVHFAFHLGPLSFTDHRKCRAAS